VSGARPWPYPWRPMPVEIASSATPEELLDRLGRRLAGAARREFVPDLPDLPAPTGWTALVPTHLYPRPRVLGEKFGGHQFSLWWVRTRDLFPRRLTATVLPADGGSLIRGKLAMHPVMLVFFGLWYALVLSFWFSFGVVGEGLAKLMDRTPPADHSVGTTLALTGFLVFGVLGHSLGARLVAVDDAFLLAWVREQAAG
jgi:hypothetical protein